MKLPKSFWLLFACEVLMTGGLALSFPFFALYLHTQRGMPMDSVGALLALTLLTVALSQGLGGALSDWIGRRRMMVSALLARTVLVYLLAKALSSQQPISYVVAAHLSASFAGNFFHPAVRSWLADHCGLKERVRVYGLLRVATNIGWALGPALGGWIAESSYAGMFLATSAISGFCALALMVWIQDKEGLRRCEDFSFRELFEVARDRRLFAFCSYTFLIAIVLAHMVTPLSVHAAQFLRLSEREVGFLFSINGLLVVATQVPVTHGASYFRISTALVLGCCLYSLGYGAVGFASGFSGLAAAMIVITLGEVLLSPGLQAMAVNLAPHGKTGRYVGFHALMQQMGSAFGPLCGGFALQHLSPRWIAWPWLIASGLALAAGAGFYSLRSSWTPEEEGLRDQEPSIVMEEARTLIGA